MFERPQTIRQATELWVECRLDAINLDIIERLMKYELDKWCEVTVPAVGDMVFVHKMDSVRQWRENLCANRGILPLNMTRGSLRGKQCGLSVTALTTVD